MTNPSTSPDKNTEDAHSEPINSESNKSTSNRPESSTEDSEGIDVEDTESADTEPADTESKVSTATASETTPADEELTSLPLNAAPATDSDVERVAESHDVADPPHHNTAGDARPETANAGDSASAETDDSSPSIAGPGVMALKDMGESPPRDECANCGTPLIGPYCSQCGQRAADRIVPLHEMTQEWVEDLFEFDLRIFRTLPTFFFKPGRLTKEYVQGRRVRYVRPLRLYLVASFILFTVLAFSDVATIDGLDGSSEASGVADSTAASASDGAAPVSPKADTVSGAIAEAKRRASSQKNVGLTVGASGTEASSSRTVDPEKLRRELRAIDSLGGADPATIDSIVSAHVGTATETFASAGGQRSDGQRVSSADTSDSDADMRAGDGSFASVEQRRKMAEEVTKDISIKVPFIQDEAQKRQTERYVKNRIAQTIIDPNGFIRGMIDRAPYVMFLLLPLFAFLLKLLYIRRGKLYVQHLIFALHIHAFIFLTFALSTGMLVSDLPSLQTIGGWLTLAPFIYVYIAMQHVYGQGWIKTGIKMIILFTLYNTVLTFGILILAIASLLLM